MNTFFIFQWMTIDDNHPSHIREFHGPIDEAIEEAKKAHKKGKALTTTTLLQLNRAEATIRFHKGPKK